MSDGQWPSVGDAIQAMEFAADIVKPLIGEIAQAILQNKDPLDVLRDERVLDIMPSKSQTEIRMFQARLQARKQQQKPPSP